MRGIPSTGSHIVCPQSKAKTIWLLRSVSYSLAIEVDVPGRAFPVDPAAVHARLVIGQRLELAALAAHPPRDQAELRVAQESLQGGRTHCADIGPDAHSHVQRLAEHAARRGRAARSSAATAFRTMPVPRRLGVKGDGGLPVTRGAERMPCSAPARNRRGSAASAQPTPLPAARETLADLQ
jgi:hypothetical protein